METSKPVDESIEVEAKSTVTSQGCYNQFKTKVQTPPSFDISIKIHKIT